jgi:hypothetical protein
MTASEFRNLALDLPQTCESSHMDHPDFRVGGKIFATLGPAEAWGMVKLKPPQQQRLMRAEPRAFAPAAGAWGKRGSTIVHLESARIETVRDALKLAWLNVAPKRIAQRYAEPA